VIRQLALKNKIVAEGAGALAVAAALNAGSSAGRSVAIISGGSIDGATLAEIVGA
jgi:threonine dehydratase